MSRDTTFVGDGLEGTLSQALFECGEWIRLRLRGVCNGLGNVVNRRCFRGTCSSIY